MLQVKTLIQRLNAAGITSLGEAQAEYALSWYPDDLDKAYDVLVLASDSFDGILKDYDSGVTMLGAVNRNMVTCYLDALLFAMFARLDSFEAMLFDNFADEPRKKLAGILRLWVNLLRSGQLIRVDLVRLLLCDYATSADFFLDQTPAGGIGQMWMGGRCRNPPAGRIGSLHVYYRRPGVASAHVENGHLSYWERRQRR